MVSSGIVRVLSCEFKTRITKYLLAKQTYLSLESELSCKLHREGFPEGEDVTKSAVFPSLLNGEGNNIKPFNHK